MAPAARMTSRLAYAVKKSSAEGRVEVFVEGVAANCTPVATREEAEVLEKSIFVTVCSTRVSQFGRKRSTGVRYEAAEELLLSLSNLFRL